MQTADWLRTIVFRVRKQWDYCCHVLICMVKTIVRSLRFTLTGLIIIPNSLILSVNVSTYLSYISSFLISL